MLCSGHRRESLGIRRVPEAQPSIAVRRQCRQRAGLGVARCDLFACFRARVQGSVAWLVSSWLRSFLLFKHEVVQSLVRREHEAVIAIRAVVHRGPLSIKRSAL